MPTIYVFEQKYQIIDCGYPLEPGGSNEYLQSMFLSRNRKTIMYIYYYIKMGFKGVKIIQACFVMSFL